MSEDHKVTHTPGPWKYGFEDANDPEWAIVTIPGGMIVANVNSNGRQEANARLISAAPELLEAGIPFSELKIDETAPDDYLQPVLVTRRQVRELRLAISKAEGHEP